MLRSNRRTFLTSLAALAIGARASDAFARQLSGRPAPDWIARLERPERVAGLKVDEIVQRLGLKPGQVVADIGAGPGIFEPALAKAVSPGGKVYAVEIDQAFIDHINGKIKDQHITNVVPVLGAYTDPKLPSKDVDLAMFHDVLHHVEKRAEYLKALSPYLKPNGRIAVIELDAKKGSHNDDPTLQVTKEQLKAWMADAGLRPQEEFNLSEEKWFVIYGKGAGTR